MKAAFVLATMLALAVGAWLGFAPSAASQLRIDQAVVQPLADGGYGVFLTIDNKGAPDRLVAASSLATQATLYSPAAAEGPPVPVGRASLALDGAHIRLPKGDATLEHGALVPLTLSFETAGEVSLKARLSDPAAQGQAAEVGLFGLGDICIVGDGEPAPQIAISFAQQGDSWRINIDSEEFTFSEDLMGLYHVPGMGHGHIYVGGMKLDRLFAPQYTIGSLPKGRHEVRVTLNTNDHRAYVVDDVPVTASTFIMVD